MKFKVGDMVRVRDDSKYRHGRYAGRIGKIGSIMNKEPYPYRVGFNSDESYFHANELERLEEL